MPIAPNDPAIDAADAAMLERRAFAVPATTFTANASTEAWYVGDRGTLRATLTCSARSGAAPTCDVTVSTAPSADGPWSPAGTFTQLTAVGAERRAFAVDRWVRFDVAVGGTTPSFTLAADAEAV